MKRTLITALMLATALPALAGHKIQGNTTLKDLQPLGSVDKNKHQAYDLSFTGQGNNYTCRTDPGKSVNPTDFVVGSDITYEVDGKKVKIKTPRNKKVECAVVRVEAVSAQPAQ